MIKDNEFLNGLRQKAEDVIGEGYYVDILKVDKMNGVVLTGLGIYQEQRELAKIQYLESYYEEYKMGRTMEDIALCLVAEYMISPELGISIGDFMDFDMMKSKVVVRLVNLGRNREFLKGVPYIPVQDLAAVFYILCGMNEEGQYSTVVRDEHLSAWGVDSAALMKIALENSQRLLPVSFRPINDVLMGFTDIEDLPEGMTLEDIAAAPSSCYVLSNRYTLYGASVVLYPGVLQKIADSMEQDLMLLPSSLHEFLIVNPDFTLSKEEALEMVEMVNQTEVLPEDFLADSVYMFHRSLGKLERIGS